MMSPLPWRSDDEGRMFDGDGEMIAEGYKFFDLDDFEGLAEFVNLGAAAYPEKAKRRYFPKEVLSGPRDGEAT